MAKIKNTKKNFLKQTVIGFGFLSGLWIHMGFDPGNFVSFYLEKILIMAEPQYETVIAAIFIYSPIILTLFSVLVAYRRGGYLGLLAVLLAFLAGLWLNLFSIVLFLAALVIGLFAAKRY